MNNSDHFEFLIQELQNYDYSSQPAHSSQNSNNWKRGPHKGKKYNQSSMKMAEEKKAPTIEKVMPSIKEMKNMRPEKILNESGIAGLERAMVKVKGTLEDIEKLKKALEDRKREGEEKIQSLNDLIKREKRIKENKRIDSEEQESLLVKSPQEIKVDLFNVKEKFKPIQTPIREASLTQEMRKTSANEARSKPRLTNLLNQEQKQLDFTPLLDKRSSLLEPHKETRLTTYEDFIHGFDFNQSQFNQEQHQEEKQSQTVQSREMKNLFKDQLESKYNIILNTTRKRKALRIKEREESQQSKENSKEDTGRVNQGAQDEMPDYKSMEVKELKENASKFGLKPSLVKSDLIKSLEEIWKFQHEGVQMTEFERLMWQQRRDQRQSKGRKNKKKSSSQTALVRGEGGEVEESQDYLPQHLQWLSQLSQR